MGMLKKRNKGPRKIPTPTGPYSVGCTDVMTNYSPNGVFIRLFYPVKKIKINSRSPDWLPHESYLEGCAMFFKMWPPLFCKYFPKFVGDISIPAMWDAPPLRIPGQRFPVLVFSHGLGGCRTSYTTICLEMASQGYVVAAVEHRDYSACMSFYYEHQDTSKPTNEQNSKDLVKRWMLFKKVKQGKGEYTIRNQQVHQRAEECSSVLNLLNSLDSSEPVDNVMETSHLPLEYFQGLLDLDRASIAGHSFGGATVVMAMAKDKRFKVGLGLDTWMLPLREESVLLKKVEQPMLFINMEKFQTRSNLRLMKQLQTSSTKRLVVTLKGTVHLNQCDVPFLCDRTMRRLFGAHSSLDRFTAMGLTTALSQVFLGKHLGTQIDGKHEVYIHQHQNVLRKGIWV
ncbi:platelet-activating factor acetylhydrolase-like [Uloborus diversus]|uniref:platelet-activating factor acetylhydrolase-like n=1 Tax=Uloborus diversus TaxID=327109 RepID=UPI0024092BD7|nr:platelet-activating factor acetylhydrolase-like [Uloborus diversus]